MAPLIHRVSIAAFCICIVGGLTNCGSKVTAVQAVDAYVIMPPGAPGKEQYRRTYLLTQVQTTSDTPFFTSSTEFSLPKPLHVWAAVFVRSAGDVRPGSLGVNVAKQRTEMPQVFHGGCDVVNVIADATTGRTLTSWCNVGDIRSPSEQLRPIPNYRAPGSPIE
jgi:hypothetical protein